MNIPDNYKVGFFQGGATQQFAMVPLNFMTTGKADYIVSGNFSDLAAKEAAKFRAAFCVLRRVRRLELNNTIRSVLFSPRALCAKRFCFTSSASFTAAFKSPISLILSQATQN